MIILGFIIQLKDYIILKRDLLIEKVNKNKKNLTFTSNLLYFKN